MMPKMCPTYHPPKKNSRHTHHDARTPEDAVVCSTLSRDSAADHLGRTRSARHPPPRNHSDCSTRDGICLPSWEPTWDMYRSTLLYTCNTSGMHDVNDAVKFGTVVYDWSNAKAVWANGHPMNSEELITKQAEAVLARDPGIPGQAPRVWAYRNTIKALNWYSSVREKLDDPRYASWFIKFKGFSNSPYPGGGQQGR